MTDRIEVCPEEDLKLGERRLIDANGLTIGVFNIDGNYHALLNNCRHQFGPVCEGKIQRQLSGEFEGPGKRVHEYFEENYTVACPWHGWEYDIETGEHIGDSDTALETFDVIVDQGIIYLDDQCENSERE